MPLPKRYYTNIRGQCAVMLLTALRELYVNDGFRTVKKQQAISFIQEMGWFALEAEDLVPYASQASEPRWHGLFAWARKDTVLNDLVSYETRDAWGLTHDGRVAIDLFIKYSKEGARPANSCFLWSEKFKVFLNPSYTPHSENAKRPPQGIYRDGWGNFLDKLDY